MSKLTCIVVILLLTGMTSSVEASGSRFNSGFDEGIKSAEAMQSKAFDSIKKFNPQATFKNYTAHPKESEFLNNPDLIKGNVDASRNNDTVAFSIYESIDRHPIFAIQADQPMIKNIMQRSDEISHVLTGSTGDCIKKSSCTVTSKIETCTETLSRSERSCKRTLHVKMLPHMRETHYYLTAHLWPMLPSQASVSVNVVNGQISKLLPSIARFDLEGRLPSVIDCHTVQGKIISRTGTQLRSIDLPSCSNNLRLSFATKFSQNAALKIDMVSSVTEYEAQDNWNEECGGSPPLGRCYISEEQCTAPYATRDIQQTPVTRNCWEYDTRYQCTTSVTGSACQAYRDQGCAQTNSQCQIAGGSGCQQYMQTFHCTVNECHDDGLICHEQTFCLNGDCIKPQRQNDPDFQRAVSALSATHEAAKSFTDFNSIFGGHGATCDRVFLGFINCCSDHGWGKDIHLAQCNKEAKDLGVARENLQTVELGEYCSKEVLDVCVEHKRAFCVFPSKLAKIIQEQGRGGQLRIGFGTPEAPDCRGLTREQFATLDLGKMNFSDFYSDLASKQSLEDQENIASRLNKKMQQWSEEKIAHG